MSSSINTYCTISFDSFNRITEIHQSIFSLQLIFSTLQLSVFLIWYQSTVFLLMANQDQTSQTLSSPSTAHRELSPMEDLRSPFFLHHGESPGEILVTQPLTEDNYPNWARAMRMALDAKSKLGFVDGTVTASMAITPLEKIAWSKNNSMISSWILNSVFPHISGSVIYIKLQWRFGIH